MTNDQRKALLSAIQDHHSVHSSPREQFVKIRWKGVSIKVDHCLKHGTGSGRVVGVVGDVDAEIPDSFSDIDKILIEIAESHCESLRESFNHIQTALQPFK